MKLHPLCKLFPEIGGIDLLALIEDIKANGLRQPIITLDGKILDGQNRFNACHGAGVEPAFEEYTGDDPLAFVVSQNMSRRHLTESQRAAIAAEIVTANRGKSKSANLQIKTTTAAQAAEKMKVSPRSVQTAKKLKKESPAAFKKVKAGKMSLNAAHEKKHPRKPKQEASKSIPRGGLYAEKMRHEQPEKKTLPNPVLPEETSAPVTDPITAKEFQAALDALESRIPADADHKKFGAIANKLADRLMNHGKKNMSAYY